MKTGMSINEQGRQTGMKISIETRKRIEAQGYLGLDDHSLGRIRYAIRVTPALCMIWALTGILIQSSPMLWVFVPFAILSAFLPVHPFDALYNYGLRYLVTGPRLPRFPKPRRFSCLIAAAMVSGAAAVVQTGNLTGQYIIGSIILLVGLMQLLRGLCVPSMIYGWLFGKPASCDL